MADQISTGVSLVQGIVFSRSQKPSGKMQDLFPLMPDTDGSAQLTELVEICREEIAETGRSIVSEVVPYFLQIGVLLCQLLERFVQVETGAQVTLLLAQSSLTQCRNRRDCNSKPVRSEVTAGPSMRVCFASGVRPSSCKQNAA